jgi:hypothetical protein
VIYIRIHISYTIDIEKKKKEKKKKKKERRRRRNLFFFLLLVLFFFLKKIWFLATWIRGRWLKILFLKNKNKNAISHVCVPSG